MGTPISLARGDRIGAWADQLIARLDALDEWPDPAFARQLERVNRGIALREGDEDTLRHMAGYDQGERANQRFIRDPMPPRISAAFSSLIFGRQPEFTAAAEGDQVRLDEIVEGNNFRSELGQAARRASSEGESWWRVLIDKTITDVPILEWLSRTAVYPLWRGSRLLAVAVIDQLSDFDDFEWRRFEVHDVDVDVDTGDARGMVTNVLYRRPDPSVLDEMADEDQLRFKGLGERVDLTAHPETENDPPEWRHGLDGMLVGRVANMIDSDPTLGVSDYAPIEDWLLELSVAASIGHINMELTARKRVLVPFAAVNESGAVDLGEQVHVREMVDRDLGASDDSGRAFQVLEYNFDAEALIAYKREIERTALNRIGIDAQYAGVDPAQGRAESGTALRIRLIPSKAAADDRAQEWDQRLPEAVRMLQGADALGVDQRGFGTTWAKADEAPTMDRGATLPEDDVEKTERVVTAKEGGAMSTETAVREINPDWDDDAVEAELRRIAADEKSKAAAASAPFGVTIPREPSSDTEDTGGQALIAAGDGSA